MRKNFKIILLLLLSLCLPFFLAFDTKPNKIELIGILKQDTTTGTWQLLNDKFHTSLNIVSVSQDSNQIRINHNFTAGKVISFIVTTDDVLNGTGYVFGADVGLSYTNIIIRKPSPLSGFIYSDGNGGFNIRDNVGIQKISYSNGIISIIHEKSLNPLSAPITTIFGDSKYNLQPYNFGSTLSEFKLVSKNGDALTNIPPVLNPGDLFFFFQRESMTSSVNISPNTPMLEGNNIFIYGVFEQQQ